MKMGNKLHINILTIYIVLIVHVANNVAQIQINIPVISVSSIKRKFISLASEAEKTIRKIGDPWIRRSNNIYKNSRDFMDTLEDIPIVGDVSLRIKNAVDVGRAWMTPTLKNAVATLEQACSPLTSLAEYLRYNMKTEIEALNVTFVTPRGLLSARIAQAPDKIITSKYFDRNKKTVLYIHGFTEDPTQWSFSEISLAFKVRGGYNILALDSSPILRSLYFKARTSVRDIGKRLALVLVKMVEDGVTPQDILLVGHSLGAHIAAHAGRHFLKLTGKKVHRISALDPAGPCFEGIINPKMKPSKDDADFVDVIHTNAGIAGLKSPYGHVDFYVNGGTAQAGCFEVVCDHNRAFEYYAESVFDEDSFFGVQCDSWANFKSGLCKDGQITRMGFGANKNASGLFYLRTAPRKPYGLQYAGIRSKT